MQTNAGNWFKSSITPNKANNQSKVVIMSKSGKKRLNGWMNKYHAFLHSSVCKGVRLRVTQSPGKCKGNKGWRRRGCRDNRTLCGVKKRKGKVRILGWERKVEEEDYISDPDPLTLPLLYLCVVSEEVKARLTFRVCCSTDSHERGGPKKVCSLTRCKGEEGRTSDGLTNGKSAKNSDLLNTFNRNVHT